MSFLISNEVASDAKHGVMPHAARDPIARAYAVHCRDDSSDRPNSNRDCLTMIFSTQIGAQFCVELETTYIFRFFVRKRPAAEFLLLLFLQLSTF